MRDPQICNGHRNSFTDDDTDIASERSFSFSTGRNLCHQRRPLKKEDLMIISSGTVSMGAKRDYVSQMRREKEFRIVNMKRMDSDNIESRKQKEGLKIGFNNELRYPENERSLEELRRSSLMYLLSNLHRILFGRGHDAAAGISYNSTGNQQTIASYTEYASYEESEQTDFQTTGTVITADGRQIEFGLSLTMSRRFKEEYLKQTAITAQNALNVLDPLVINLNGNISSVSDQKVMFDLDSDGEKDSISVLNSDSGYLSLDLNGDGIINDGSELFGTKSGDGFSDLAAYDEDGNGWIDEADSVFNRLKITVMDADGKQTLYSLKDKGVGAICLKRVETDFSLKSLKDNRTNGMIRETGFFLFESGKAGTVQHLDLVR